VCRKIKANSETADTRVVVMTGFNSPENIAKALDAGAEACLAKPLDKAQLFKTIVLGLSG
jgi:CheY-like chemotaxis protein